MVCSPTAVTRTASKTAMTSVPLCTWYEEGTTRAATLDATLSHAVLMLQASTPSSFRDGIQDIQASTAHVITMSWYHVTTAATREHHPSRHADMLSHRLNAVQLIQLHVEKTAVDLRVCLKLYTFLGTMLLTLVMPRLFRPTNVLTVCRNGNQGEQLDQSDDQDPM